MSDRLEVAAAVQLACELHEHPCTFIASYMCTARKVCWPYAQVACNCTQLPCVLHTPASKLHASCMALLAITKLSYHDATAETIDVRSSVVVYNTRLHDLSMALCIRDMLYTSV